WAAPRTSTSPSGPASTSVWAHHWPGWKASWRWPPWCAASPPWSWPWTASSTRRTSSSEGWQHSPWRSDAAPATIWQHMSNNKTANLEHRIRQLDGVVSCQLTETEVVVMLADGADMV